MLQTLPGSLGTGVEPHRPLEGREPQIALSKEDVRPPQKVIVLGHPLRDKTHPGLQPGVEGLVQLGGPGEVLDRLLVPLSPVVRHPQPAEAAGVFGVHLDRLLQVRLGPLQLLLVVVQPPQDLVGHRVPTVHLDRLLQVADGLVECAQCTVVHCDLNVDEPQLGSAVRRPLVGFDSRGVFAHRLVDVAEMVMATEVPRGQGDGPLCALQRLVPALHIGIGLGQVGQSWGALRIELQRLQRSDDGLIVLPVPIQSESQSSMRRGVGGIQRHGALRHLHRLSVLTPQGQHVPQLGVGRGVLGIQVGRATEGVQGLVQLALSEESLPGCQLIGAGFTFLPCFVGSNPRLQPIQDGWRDIASRQLRLGPDDGQGKKTQQEDGRRGSSPSGPERRAPPRVQIQRVPSRGL